MKVLDAKNQKLGRIASEAAKILMGKHTPHYEPQRITGEEVHITNASHADFSEKKMKEKEYTRYTQYPGGLKFTTLEEMIAKKGYEEVFKKAVKRMLPANRLRDDRMKMLKITD